MIEKFAKENNVWIDDVDSTMQANFGEQIGQGGESVVYEGEDGTVVKSIGADYYNGDIQLLLDRILIHNYLFPETALTDIGFGRDSLGNIRVIAAQKFIKGSEPSREEIVEYAKNRGFKTEDGNTYYYKGIKISDLNQLNLIKAENGQLFVIDNELSFVTNE